MKLNFKRDTSFRKQFFVPDSFAHPAKMDAQLLIWIVEHYSKVGETILDLMAGSGTTMLACILGRHCILVELEAKFCKMMLDNWERVKMRPQLGSTMGDCQIIQGDARRLEGLLVDKCVFSPPFAGAKQGDHSRDEDYTDDRWHQIGGIRHRADKTADNPNNIGNLPYGQIDKIVTSPPYASGGHHPDQTGAWGGQAQALTKEQANYGQSEGQIGQLPYGNIDSIITSPPYEEGKAFQDFNFMAKQADDYPDRLRRGLMKGHNRTAEAERRYLEKIAGGQIEYSQNIGNLKSDSYLEAMLQVYQQCYKVLKPEGGLLILVTKNFIRNRQVVRLDEDTIKLCEQAGFTFVERHYRELTHQSFWRTIYHQKYPGVEQIKHEDILVFQK